MITITDKEFNEIITFIKSNYGINLSQKRHLIEGRLHNLLVEKGYDNYSDYLNYIMKDNSKGEITILINKLTTNHTFFMREFQHLEYFRDKSIPFLESSVKNRDLRIWSAGCSSGEEPYTLAMILEDYFGKRNEVWDKKILATDISVNVLTKAKNGVFLSDSIEKMPKNWKVNYFKIIDKNSVQVSEKIRNQIIFRIFNLMDKFPFKKKFHVIFCRNVMIYFDQKTKIELVKKFYDSTEPGGYLFIGQSETISSKDIGYEYIMPSLYRKG